jgi:MFS family permease
LLAEDKIGFKPFMVSGFLILSLFALVAFFVNNIFIVLGLLVLASFGSALIEPSGEAYFFKLVPKTKEEKFYGPFLTYANIWGTIGNLVTAGILIFLPFRFVFLGLSLSMLVFAYLSTRLKK